MSAWFGIQDCNTEIVVIPAKIDLDFHKVQSDQYHNQTEKEDHIMILNTHPENRKDMVRAICELTGLPSAYMGMPSAAYQIGPITVGRDGSIVCEDEAMLSSIKPMLIERGWLEAEAQSEMPAEPESLADSKEVPDTMETIGIEQMDITMPIPGWTVAQATNLLRMLCSKQILINRMLGCDMLSIEESFVQAMSENPPESTADLEARVQEAIDAGSICGFRLDDERVTLSTPFAQEEPTRWKAYPENRDEYRAEAYETCPGLTELWTEPFTARYDSKDSPVMLRFRMTESGDVQGAANILEAK